jgi:hypothetical protein
MRGGGTGEGAGLRQAHRGSCEDTVGKGGGEWGGWTARMSGRGGAA